MRRRGLHAGNQEHEGIAGLRTDAELLGSLRGGQVTHEVILPIQLSRVLNDPPATGELPVRVLLPIDGAKPASSRSWVGGRVDSPRAGTVPGRRVRRRGLRFRGPTPKEPH
ncbi:hypothetical protein Pth03_49020 [Planotetraspora thailandica]|uniref:Uncharacterized protein n=1 Tax=Planotetraspora thailandica TaxID=487172 RepID=A0A8J3V4B1_9ACTN|nr:hypothetical protein Pth03_49020 [Planotetraspora thailandica]